MAVHSLFPREERDLQVVPVSEGHWVVWSEPSSGSANPPQLLGHIDLHTGRYEVLQFGDPLILAGYPSLVLAVHHFVIPAILGDNTPRLSSPTLGRPHRFTA